MNDNDRHIRDRNSDGFWGGAPVGADVLRWVWTDHRNPQLALAAAVVTGLCGPRESIDVCCLTW